MRHASGYLPLVEGALAADDGVLGAARGQPHEGAAVARECAHEAIDLALEVGQRERIALRVLVVLLLLALSPSLAVELAHQRLIAPPQPLLCACAVCAMCGVCGVCGVCTRASSMERSRNSVANVCS